MATPDLVKYYECLKDSFNKIQARDNTTALVNAALRPKIREEFIKSRDILVSYLNYIQVFTSIYGDKFNNICATIICPMFKEHPIKNQADIENNNGDVENLENNDDIAMLVHDAVKEILKSKPELIEEYIHCITKFFPACYNEDYNTFINYVENSLEICSYVRGEPLTSLLSKILDRVNPPTRVKSQESNSEDKIDGIDRCITKSYELIYKRFETLERRQLDNVAAAILAAFSRDFLTSENGGPLNYLILHICSLDDKLASLFINLLWATFTNTNRPVDERRASVIYASSFMSRALYVELDKVLSHLESAVAWCNEFQFENQTDDEPSPETFNENVELFYALVQSILYLITQRYRELYEKESIERLQQLDLDRILCDKLKPLEVCDNDTEQRFREVASLYGISKLKPVDKSATVLKKRKTSNTPTQFKWRAPYKESNQSVPKHVRHLYRNYYDHRNFTIFRE